MNLKESVRQWVLQNLPYDRSEAPLVAYLKGLDAHGLLVVYHNWVNRLVKPQRRTVHQSKAFQKNPLTTQRASDLAQIIDDIEQGCNLAKYLSRDVARAPVKVPGKQRPDLDLMLNEWGVHHLHISTQVDPDGFVRRVRMNGPKEPLLFVAFRPQAAYLIDIMRHGDWTRHHVLEVLATEWPNEGVIHEIKGVLGLTGQRTESERAVLRKKHITSYFEFGGKVFAPRGLLTAAGFSIHSTREADRCLDRVEVFERHIRLNPECLRRDFERHGLAFPDQPNFEFAIREDGYGVIETNTRAWINLSTE